VELAPAEAGLLASRCADCNQTESNLKSGAFVDTEGVSLSHMANEHGLARVYIRIVEPHDEYSPAKRLIRSLISSVVKGVGLAKPGTLSWTSEGPLGLGLTYHQGNVSGSVRSPRSHAVGCCCISVRCRCAAAEGREGEIMCSCAGKRPPHRRVCLPPCMADLHKSSRIVSRGCRGIFSECGLHFAAGRPVDDLQVAVTGGSGFSASPQGQALMSVYVALQPRVKGKLLRYSQRCPASRGDKGRFGRCL
jgi:hypothetical protein